MAIKQTSHFTKGTGCYTCGCCGRKTRETDQDAAEHMQCAQCWELVGLENEVSDSGLTEGQQVQRIAQLQAEIAELGGKL